MTNQTQSASPLVSIVMPVYNTRAFLPETLDTILAQSYANWECICVDDGSTDGSDEIVRMYSLLDVRVRLVSQKNSGAAAARNRGIMEVLGEYMVFVDADDLLASDMLCSCVKRMQEDASDLCIFEIDSFESASREPALFRCRVPMRDAGEYEVFCPHERLEGLLISIPAAPWNKMYRTEWLRQKKIIFPEDIRRCEDMPFSALCVAEARRISCIPRVFYHYRLNRAGSQMTTLNDESVCYCYIDAAKFLWDELRSRSLIMNYAFEALIASLGNAHYYFAFLANNITILRGAYRLRRWVRDALTDVKQSGVKLSPKQLWQIRRTLYAFVYHCHKKFLFGSSS